MSEWIQGQTGGDDAADLGPLQLAWLGDAVWELHQRLRFCRSPGRADVLHRAVVARVCAQAQAEALGQLDPVLSDQERDLVRRGRNRAGRGPKRSDAAVYGLATGFETMVGWLYLHDPARLAELFDHLDQAGTLSTSRTPRP